MHITHNHHVKRIAYNDVTGEVMVVAETRAYVHVKIEDYFRDLNET